MSGNIKTLILTTGEAYLVDFAIPESDDFRGLLTVVGRAIVEDGEAKLGMTENELWLIRDIVDPSMKMGKVTGSDIRRKVYTLILEFEHDRLINSIPGNVREKSANVALMEVCHASRGTSEDTDEDTATRV